MTVEDTTVSPVSATDEFSFIGPPTVTGITPPDGPAQGNTSVVIDGSNFAGEVSVAFGGVAAKAVHVDSSTELTVTTPPGSGIAPVTVTNIAGSSPGEPAANYTFLAAPIINSITPAVGPTKGGTVVTILGTDLVGDVSVLFGNKPAQSVDHVSSTELRAVTPPGSGDTQVTVENVSGSNAATAATAYDYLPPPAVTEITPAVGPQKGGARVTIRGRGFVGKVSVHFGDRPARSVRVVSPSEVSVVVPPGSGASFVTISAAGGSSTTGGRARYIFLGLPSVRRVSPDLGSEKRGHEGGNLGEQFRRRGIGSLRPQTRDPRTPRFLLGAGSHRTAGLPASPM